MLGSAIPHEIWLQKECVGGNTSNKESQKHKRLVIKEEEGKQKVR